MANGPGVFSCSFRRALCTHVARSEPRQFRAVFFPRIARRVLSVRAHRSTNRIRFRVVVRLTCLVALQTLRRPFSSRVRGDGRALWLASGLRDERLVSRLRAGALDKQVTSIVRSVCSAVRSRGRGFRRRVSGGRVFGRSHRGLRVTLPKDSSWRQSLHK
jgi:hypothetical protein